MKQWFRLVLLCLGLLLPGQLHAQLVVLDTSDGATRLHRAIGGPQALGLLAHLETEVFLTFCGPASLATALNSLGVNEPSPAAFYPYRRITQESLFTPANLAVKTFAAVQAGGLTLDQLAAFARNLGASAEAVHADTLDLATLRARISAALTDPASRVIVNYSRIPLGQQGDGHISPLAAYDAESDTALVLDVARYKYRPVWVPLATLLTAMQRLDTDSARARGLLFLSVRQPR